jgi:hypothetical protein
VVAIQQEPYSFVPLDRAILSWSDYGELLVAATGFDPTS